MGRSARLAPKRDFTPIRCRERQDGKVIREGVMRKEFQSIDLNSVGM